MFLFRMNVSFSNFEEERIHNVWKTFVMALIPNPALKSHTTDLDIDESWKKPGEYILQIILF